MTESIINIELDDKKYTLVIKITDESMTFIVNDPEEIVGLKYITKKTLKDIKGMDGLKDLENCAQFLNYLKMLGESKLLLLNKKEDKISMNFTVEYLFKKNEVEIDLFPERGNTDDLIKQLCKEFNSLKEEVKVLKTNKN